MNDTAEFKNGVKAVISPDKMRAWVTLEPSAAQAKPSAAFIEQLLAESGVVYGINPSLVQAAAASNRYNELLEVAIGKEATISTGRHYSFLMDIKPFTGLNGNSDGSLYYDDLSFLQTASENQILVENFPAQEGAEGITVTGEPVAPKAAEQDFVLDGSGFIVTDEGRYYRAPSLSHVNLVNNRLVVTPLQIISSLSAEDAPLTFDGNVFVEKDVLNGASITASGSVFVAGRTASANIIAGRNILLSGGMSGRGEFSHIEAKENVWGLFFESAEIIAGASLHSNYLAGCEVRCEGRISILGGRGIITNSSVYAANGIVTQDIGSQNGDKSILSAGMEKELIDRFDTLEQRIEKMNYEIHSTQQNISAYERINRTKPDKGRNDASYKEMVARKSQNLTVLKIITGERTRVKRKMDKFSNISIVARGRVSAGVTIEIDTRSLTTTKQLNKVKFRRDGEEIKVIVSGIR